MIIKRQNAQQLKTEAQQTAKRQAMARASAAKADLANNKTGQSTEKKASANAEQHATAKQTEHLQTTPTELPGPEPSVPWSAEAIDAGLLPERRQDDRRTERRRDYRRVEDKELISKAYEEANAIRENAHREGFEAGLKDSEAVTEEMRQAIQKLLNAREDAILAAMDDLVPIAVMVAEKILQTEVSCDPSLVKALVEDTLKKAGRNHKNILVKVHADDVETVREEIDGIKTRHMLNSEIVVLEDPAVDLGSCIVETNSGLIDASFTTQLEMLRRLLGLTGGTNP
ncbi:MAG: FliH/SctL family protein [Candidatus Melainabacteria bacterium]|nr:FliH/SctL family protein [Candidatus Melainabacteria bacterium]